jgi:hypothetical protein
MRYPKPGGRRHGKEGGVLLLRVVVYALLLGLPASLLVAVAAGMRFGGNDAPRVNDVARWTDQVLDQAVADVLDDSLSEQRGCALPRIRRAHFAADVSERPWR